MNQQTIDPLTGRPPVHADIDLLETRGIRLDRLEKALSLKVTPLRTGPGQFRVTGGREPHYVDLVSEGVPPCDCGDFLMRGEACKHQLAVLLFIGDRRILFPLLQLTRTLKAKMEQAAMRKA